MLIMSQKEHHKTSDLTDASAGPVLVPEVQMIHLLGGKVRDWFYVREPKYENIYYSIEKIFDVSSHELPVLKFIEESRLFLESKWEPRHEWRRHGFGELMLGYVCDPPDPEKRWAVVMDKTCRMSGVGTKMETQEGKFKIVQNLLVNEIMVIIFLFIIFF